MENVSTTDVPQETINRFFANANDLAVKSGVEKFDVDRDNRKVIYGLLKYFSGIKARYELDGIETTVFPTKGLLIGGNVGSGKTLIMEAMQLTFPKEIQYVTTARKVAGDFLEDGQKAILKHSKHMKSHGQGYVYPGSFFDDLGAEDSKKHYGNETNVMAELISDRYDLFVKNGSKSFFTTNLTKQEIEDKYGLRVLSRLKQMCNFILLDCKTDRRK